MQVRFFFNGLVAKGTLLVVSKVGGMPDKPVMPLPWPLVWVAGQETASVPGSLCTAELHTAKRPGCLHKGSAPGPSLWFLLPRPHSAPLSRSCLPKSAVALPSYPLLPFPWALQMPERLEPGVGIREGVKLVLRKSMIKVPPDGPPVCRHHKPVPFAASWRRQDVPQGVPQAAPGPWDQALELWGEGGCAECRREAGQRLVGSNRPCSLEIRSTR